MSLREIRFRMPNYSRPLRSYLGHDTESGIEEIRALRARILELERDKAALEASIYDLLSDLSTLKLQQ